LEIIDQWLTEHGDYLLAFAVQRLHGEREVARDLLQDTLLAAWRGREGFEGRSSERSWLTGILKHKIIDHIRQQIRTEHVSQTVGSDPNSRWFAEDGHWQESPQRWRDNPEQLCRDADFNKVLHQCMERLPALQRQLFTLRSLHGDSTASIGEALTLTTSNIHVMMHRARMQLRGCLEYHWFGIKD